MPALHLAYFSYISFLIFRLPIKQKMAQQPKIFNRLLFCFVLVILLVSKMGLADPLPTMSPPPEPTQGTPDIPPPNVRSIIIHLISFCPIKSFLLLF